MLDSSTSSHPSWRCEKIGIDGIYFGLKNIIIQAPEVSYAHSCVHWGSPYLFGSCLCSRNVPGCSIRPIFGGGTQHNSRGVPYGRCIPRKLSRSISPIDFGNKSNAEFQRPYLRKVETSDVNAYTSAPPPRFSWHLEHATKTSSWKMTWAQFFQKLNCNILKCIFAKKACSI